MKGVSHIILIPIFVVVGLSLVVGATIWIRGSLIRMLPKSEYSTLAAFRLAKREMILLWVLFLLLVSSVCFAVTVFLGNPFFGLPLLFLGPWFVKALLRFLRAKRQRFIEGSALSFFHALHGLIQMGIGLPAALFQLTTAKAGSDASPEFRRSFRAQLMKFEAGRPLTDCLGKFRAEQEWEQLGILLVMIEIAYRNGLPLSGLLDRLLPLVEIDQQSFLRMRELRTAALCQAFIAFLIPWLLEITLHFFQPDMVREFLDSQLAVPLIATVLLMESLGAWLIWRLAKFY